ncbi:homoserine kinase [Propionibacteriaceae bacterium G1746]|uniref:homoserine kinase n=1 Tax=Aestuariimicrobium sp. G57 TaxID=3418485 RepID=UPI003C24877E
MPIGVRVAATSANLGPGFDAMGLALDWYDEVTLTPGPTLVVEVEGEGAERVAQDERHLVVSTIRRGLAAFGHPDPGMAFTLRCHNRIPHSRGMGSSAAAIAAGYGLAWQLAHPGQDFDLAAICDLASDDEGHPDNAAAAVYGGAVLAWTRSGATDQSELGTVTGVAHLRLDPGIRARVFIPQFELPTAQARQVLPDALPRPQVIAQASRAALLVHALAGDPDLLHEATFDWLHQNQRGALMPRTLDLLHRLRGAGVAAVVSGAGPTVLALGTTEQLAAADAVDRAGFEMHELAVGRGLRAW